MLFLQDYLSCIRILERSQEIDANLQKLRIFAPIT